MIKGVWLSKREFKSFISKVHARQSLVKELTPYF